MRFSQLCSCVTFPFTNVLKINEFTGITVDKMLYLPNHYWLMLVLWPFSSVLLGAQTC